MSSKYGNKFEEVDKSLMTVDDSNDIYIKKETFEEIDAHNYKELTNISGNIQATDRHVKIEEDILIKEEPFEAIACTSENNIVPEKCIINEDDIYVKEETRINSFTNMEPPNKKIKTSVVWEYFTLLESNKVKCALCTKELQYGGNTSSMVRHMRSQHQNNEISPPSNELRKTQLDEMVLNMIVKDLQPFSIVEGEGFKKFIKKLDPSYALPTSQTLKKMVIKKYNEEKLKAKGIVKEVKSISITIDAWTSSSTESYMAVTGHFVDKRTKLKSILLGVINFPEIYTARNIAQKIETLMNEWDITNKVNCMVTDGAANMIECRKELQLRHTICIAHKLNTILKQSLEQSMLICDVRAKARKIVALFKSSTTIKEKFDQVQRNSSKTPLKLMQEVETRWNSTFLMLQRIIDTRESVAAVLAVYSSEISFFTPQEINLIIECLKILKPFNEATNELSAEKSVSGSKTIPLFKMLLLSLEDNVEKTTLEEVRKVGIFLSSQIREQLSLLQSTSVTSLATLMDPRFKSIGFLSDNNCRDSVKRLTTECALLGTTSRNHNDVEEEPCASSQEQCDNLWSPLDQSVQEDSKQKSSTAEALIEVQRYCNEPNIGRLQDPLVYWEKHKHLYPTLYLLACIYLSTPASSVPCERIFSKTGEKISKKRNRLSPKSLEQIIFLNNN